MDELVLQHLTDRFGTDIACIINDKLHALYALDMDATRAKMSRCIHELQVVTGCADRYCPRKLWMVRYLILGQLERCKTRPGYKAELEKQYLRRKAIEAELQAEHGDPWLSTDF